MKSTLGPQKHTRDSEYEYTQEDLLSLGLSLEEISNLSRRQYCLIQNALNTRSHKVSIEIERRDLQTLDMLKRMLRARIEELDSLMYDTDDSYCSRYGYKLSDERYRLNLKLHDIEDSYITMKRKSLGEIGRSKAIKGGGIYTSGRINTINGAINIRGLRGISL